MKTNMLSDRYTDSQGCIKLQEIIILPLDLYVVLGGKPGFHIFPEFMRCFDPKASKLGG